MRAKMLLIAISLCVVGTFAAASVAAAMGSQTEHTKDAELDKLHAVRPIAASSPILDSVDASATAPAGDPQPSVEPSVEPSASVPVTSSPPAQPLVWDSSGSSDLPPVLLCIRWRESRGDYSALSPDGLYHGAFQFLRTTWDSTARASQRLDLVGVDPAVVAPADQDAMAIALFEMQGTRPWNGACG